MNKNGQIFSLDFIISVILAVLAIGLILNFSELTVQNMKENEIFEELQIVGETASDLLVSNPDIVCKLVENDNGTPDDPDDDALSFSIIAETASQVDCRAEGKPGGRRDWHTEDEGRAQLRAPD